MLRQCLDLMKNGDGVDANVRVNCACCGGIVQENTFDNKEEQAKEEDNEVTAKEEISEVTAKQGEAVERDLLRFPKPSRTRVCSCFSCCCKSVSKEDQRMASETVDLHTTSSATILSTGICKTKLP